MLLTRILFLYLSRNFLISLLITICLVGSCLFFANIFDILNRLKSTIAPLSLIAKLALLKMPYLLNELLPICILIATLFFFHKLSRRNELIVIFSDGISIWKFLQPILFITILISIISICILQPLGAFFLSKQELIEKKITNNRTINSISLSDSGIYISEIINNEHRIYLAKTLSPETDSISGLTILALDEDYKFLKRIDTNIALLKEGKLKLIFGGIETTNDGEIKNHPYLTLHTNLDFKYIIDRFSSPENILFWKLGSLSAKLVQSGINADRFISYYYKLLFKPLYIISIVFIAACFINLNPRNIVGIKMVSTAIIVGLVIHSLREIMTAFLIANNFSFAISQLIPVTIIIASSITVILHKFE